MNRLILLASPLLLVACQDVVNGQTPSSADQATSAAASKPTHAEAGHQAQGDPLAKYQWTLNDAQDKAGKRIAGMFMRTDTPLRVEFTSDYLGIRNTCNPLFARFVRKGDLLEVGKPGSSLRVCHDKTLQALDDEVTGRLQGNLKLLLAESGAPSLTLTNAAGDKFVFAGQAIPEVRYKGPGTLLTVEVAPDTKRCNHPEIPEYQCLQVREIKLDASGKPAGDPGAYRSFYGDIVGYKHVAGVRNVVRLKRQELEAPPAGGPSVAYVLDAVIETSTAPSKGD